MKSFARRFGRRCWVRPTIWAAASSRSGSARTCIAPLILAKGRRHWVYAYIFAKKDRANIEQDELASFRTLAGLYARKTDEDFDKEVQLKELVEICR